jgi:hypothetical protein
MSFIEHVKAGACQQGPALCKSLQQYYLWNIVEIRLVGEALPTCYFADPFMVAGQTMPGIGLDGHTSMHELGT